MKLTTILLFLSATLANAATYLYPVQTPTNSLTPSTVLVIDANGKAVAGQKYTNANTASTIVSRDGSGNFSAGTITATLTGNASSATVTAAQTNGTYSGGTFTGATNIGGYYTNSVIYGGTNNATTLAGTTVTGVGFAGAGYFSGAGSFNSSSPTTSSLLEVANSLNATKCFSIGYAATNRWTMYNKVGGYVSPFFESAFDSGYPMFVFRNADSGSSGNKYVGLSLYQRNKAIGDNMLGGLFLTDNDYSSGLYTGQTFSQLALVTDTGQTNGIAIISTATGANSRVAVWTAGSERMRISSAGNVGIGTASPGVLLDVNGAATIRSSNKLGFGGSVGTDYDASVARTAAGMLTLITNVTVQGSITTGTQTKTGNYTIVTGDGGTTFADATGGAVTITLPAASSSTIGRQYQIFKVDSSGNAVNVAPNGSDTLLAGSTTNTTAQANCLRVIGYSSTAWIVNKTQ